MMRSGWLWACAVAAGVLVVIGLANPAAALRASLVLGLLVAGAALLDGAQRLIREVPTVPDSPFRPSTTVVPDRFADVPHHYAGLAPSDERRPTLSPGARSALRTVATERLWSRHGLNVWHSEHEAAIAARLSPQLWALINPHQRRPPPNDTYFHHRLGAYLTELDEL